MSWRVGSGISNRYSISILWFDPNTWVEHLDSTRILESRILTRIGSWRVENSVRPRWSGPTRPVYVQKSDHVILMNDESLTEKVKKLLSMIFIQNSWSINCIKRKFHIAEMKMFFMHTIDLLSDNMSDFVYERCAIVTSEVKLNLIFKILSKSLRHAR